MEGAFYLMHIASAGDTLGFPGLADPLTEVPSKEDLFLNMQRAIYDTETVERARILSARNDVATAAALAREIEARKGTYPQRDSRRDPVEAHVRVRSASGQISVAELRDVAYEYPVAALDALSAEELKSRLVVKLGVAKHGRWV